MLEGELNNISQFNSWEQEQIIQKVEKFIEEVEKELKDKNKSISSTFKLINSDKSGYHLFESNKGETIKVYISKEHPFIKGKVMDDTIPLFEIKFKKKDISKKESKKNFYFEENNNNFELKPLGDWPKETNEKELEISYIGVKEPSIVHFGGDNYVFSYSSEGKEKWVFIYEKHPRIKELLNQGKLKKGKKLIIRYLAEDWKTDKALFFKEFNKELEIEEV